MATKFLASARRFPAHDRPVHDRPARSAFVARAAPPAAPARPRPRE